MAEKPTVSQCRSCPWRVNCIPDRDIPNYDPGLHESLKCSIQSGVQSIQETLLVMACHYSKPEQEIACAGWLENQLGPGNNLGLRLEVIGGRLPVPITDGPQHACFEDTFRSVGRTDG